jgi:hypothetical protein
MTHPVDAASIPARPRRRFPLWIPFLLFWLLALPFVLLLSPLLFVACLFFQVNPFRGVAVYWQLYNGLRGVKVTVDDPSAPLSIRIF